MNPGRLQRLLRLITLLQGGVTLNASALAERMGVSRRTLFRDLKALEAAGIDYEYHSERGYRIEPDFFLPPVNLKVNEAMGLLLMARAAERQRGQPFYPAAVEAVRKLAATLPAEYRGITAGLLRHISVTPHAQPNQTNRTDLFVSIQRAIDERRVCRLTYLSLFDGGEIELDLHPYHLHFAVRSWYAVGRSVMHRQVRMFKLSRIRSIEVRDRRFRRPADFSIDKHLGKAWSLIPEGRVHRIELLFSTKVGRNVSEVVWHPTQESKMLDDGRCRMSFEVDGLNEITWWLLGYGDQVEVVRPKALRTKLRQVHERAAAKLR